MILPARRCLYARAVSQGIYSQSFVVFCVCSKDELVFFFIYTLYMDVKNEAREVNVA